MAYALFKAASVVEAMAQAYGLNGRHLRSTDEKAKHLYRFARDILKMNGPDSMITITTEDNEILHGAWPG